MKQLVGALRERFAAVHADHRHIAFGATWVAAFVLASKLAGAGKEMAVAWRYGVSEVVDAYQLATTLVFWLPGAFVSALTMVLVPMLVRLRQQRAEQRDFFLRELHGTVVLTGVSLAVLSLIFGPLVLPYIAGPLSEVSNQMAWQFTLGMAPLAVLALMTGFYASRLMARQRQVNTLLEGIPAVVIFVCVVLWTSGAGTGPLLWGTALGVFIQTVWLSRLARQTDGASAVPRLSWRSSHWRELYAATVVMAMGQLIMSFITPLDQYTAARLGDGAIASLGYANRVVALLISVGAIAISRGALPVMSNLHATGQAGRLYNVALRWAALMLAVGFLVAIAAWALAPWGIRLLFERGAFTPADTRVVAEIFRWGLVQIPFFFAGLVLVQLLASQGRYKIIAVCAASNLVVKLVLNFILSTWLGIAGIALATGLMYAWSVSCLSYVVLRSANKDE